MHGFWRAFVALFGGMFVGCFLCVLLLFLVYQVGVSGMVMLLGMFTTPVLTSVATLVLYGLLGTEGPTDEQQRESRCRACSHILRGISEPRCPECGEQI